MADPLIALLGEYWALFAIGAFQQTPRPPVAETRFIRNIKRLENLNAVQRVKRQVSFT